LKNIVTFTSTMFQNVLSFKENYVSQKTEEAKRNERIICEKELVDQSVGRQ
jgi:hypothetical protein